MECNICPARKECTEGQYTGACPELEDPEECPICGCDNKPSGKLGGRIVYRCRDCGIDY